MPTKSENPTVHERVSQAVARDLELLDQLQAQKDEVLKAKQAEDAVRLSPVLKEAKDAQAAIRDEAITKATALHDAAVRKASVPYNRALKAYEAACQEAKGALGKVEQDAAAEHDRAVGKAEQEQKIAAAEARAMVHRAETEVAAIQQTIDQHRKNIKDRLGIDLAKMLGL